MVVKARYITNVSLGEEANSKLQLIKRYVPSFTLAKFLTQKIMEYDLGDNNGQNQ